MVDCLGVTVEVGDIISVAVLSYKYAHLRVGLVTRLGEGYGGRPCVEAYYPATGRRLRRYGTDFVVVHKADSIPESAKEFFNLE